MSGYFDIMLAPHPKKNKTLPLTSMPCIIERIGSNTRGKAEVAVTCRCEYLRPCELEINNF